MDEPFSALDAQTRDLLMDDFEAIWARENTTAAYVTHNLHEALRMADRVMILRRRPGRVREIVDVAIRAPSAAAPAPGRSSTGFTSSSGRIYARKAQIAEREVSDG